MTNPSNLYAEKIYSEHPLVLWALDDQTDYISLISESNRNITSQWTVTGGTASSNTIGDEPFSESITTRIEGQVPSTATNQVVCISPNLVNFQNLNSNLGSFNIGTYVYFNTTFTQSVSIGYQYTDPITGLIVEELKTFLNPIFQKWSFISETFTIPDKNASLRLVLKFTFLQGGNNQASYQFYINGITTGLWSENFNTGSLGIATEAFPNNIALETSNRVVPAESYGISTDEGYYLVDKNALLAKNCSIPLVYGSSGITKLLSNSTGDPSLIVPGKGFLNKVGQHKNYTVEFWLRVN